MSQKFKWIYMFPNLLLAAFLTLWSSLAFCENDKEDLFLYTNKVACEEGIKTPSNKLDGAIDWAKPAYTRHINGVTEGYFNKDVITLYYRDDNIDKVEFKETERSTVIVTQIKELAAAIAKKNDVSGAPPPRPNCIRASYALKLARANLQITAKGTDGKSEQSFNIVTGPAEHWYLGFDLPVNNHKTLKYDQATKSLLPQDQNSQLYLSFNYSSADVVAEKNTWSLKLMLQATSRPTDSVGLGVGYRLLPENLPKQISSLLGDSSSLSLFAGHFWTKQDAKTAGGDGLLNQSTDKGWRVGISYDFGIGLPLIKK